MCDHIKENKREKKREKGEVNDVQKSPPAHLLSIFKNTQVKRPKTPEAGGDGSSAAEPVNFMGQLLNRCVLTQA